MQAQDGLGLDEQRRSPPRRNEANEQDEDGSIRSGQSRPCDLSARNFELLSQESVLSDQVVPRAEPVEDISDDGSCCGARPTADSIAEVADLVSKARTKTGRHRGVSWAGRSPAILQRINDVARRAGRYASKCPVVWNACLIKQTRLARRVMPARPAPTAQVRPVGASGRVPGPPAIRHISA